MLQGLREMGGAAQLEDIDTMDVSLPEAPAGSRDKSISEQANTNRPGFSMGAFVLEQLQRQQQMLLRAPPDLQVGGLSARGLRAGMQPRQAALELARFAWVAERRTPAKWRAGVLRSAGAEP